MPPMMVKGMDAAEGRARGLHRMAGGVVFDAPLDQPSTARSTPKGRAVAAARGPTSTRRKPKAGTLSAALSEMMTPDGRIRFNDE
jgi:hypothetical protein